jgi:hypothetical protein
MRIFWLNDSVCLQVETQTERDALLAVYNAVKNGPRLSEAQLPPLSTQAERPLVKAG